MKRENVELINAQNKILNSFQACNEFQLTGVLRKHVLKKYKNTVQPVKDWADLFRKDRIV